MYKDINSGASDGLPQLCKTCMAVFNSKLYFIADDGSKGKKQADTAGTKNIDGLAVTLWQSYLFKETSVRGATCMVIRLQSLADYNQWTNLCKHYIEPNLGIDCIVYGNDKVSRRRFFQSFQVLQYSF